VLNRPKTKRRRRSSPFSLGQRWLAGTVCAGIAVAAGPLPAEAGGYQPGDLAKVEAMVRTGYADVAQLPAEKLAELVARGDDLLILDVREEEEYRVSHIAGAIQVDPGIWSWPFLSRFGAAAKGKKVVVYCSVGVRSSKLAGRVQEGLSAAGATGVYNLVGGIFRWHNDQRPLVDDKGATALVHPYDANWGGLLLRQEHATTAPRSARMEAPR
jgi:rhodanese-related sulfurtransferase